MEKFKQALQDAHNAELKDNNGKIQQTQRNQLRARLLQALAEDLQAVMTVEGPVIEFEHEYWGSLFLDVNLTFRTPDEAYDLDVAHEQYLEKVAAENAKLEAKAKAAAERAAKAEAAKISRKKD